MPRAYITDACNGLHTDARNAHSSIINLLKLKGGDVNEQDDMGCRPIHYAANRGQTQVLRVLTHSIEAVTHLSVPQVLRVMLRNGVGRDIPDGQGKPRGACFMSFGRV